MLTPFHLAIPVDDLAKAEQFYSAILGCEKGRQSKHWIDWNFFGHQLVTHLVDEMPAQLTPNEVDNKSVPVPHFGVVLNQDLWEATASRLKRHGVEFVIAPYIRFEGQPGEQGTFFLFDPAGNALEFKYFNDMTLLFAT